VYLEINYVECNARDWNVYVFCNTKIKCVSY